MWDFCGNPNLLFLAPLAECPKRLGSPGGLDVALPKRLGSGCGGKYGPKRLGFWRMSVDRYKSPKRLGGCGLTKMCAGVGILSAAATA